MSSTPSPPYSSSSSSSSPAAPAVERPHRPLIARAFALIAAPRSVFEELIDRPSWFWTAMVTTVVSAIVVFVMWNSVIAPYAVEQAQARGTSGEQLGRIQQVYSNVGSRIGFSCGSGVFNLIFIVIIGLTLFALTTFLMGGKASVKQALAVAAHAMLVHIPKALIIVPLAIARQDPTVTLGPGALMPVSEATGFMGKTLATFLGYLDLFNLWSLALCILGMSVVSRLAAKQVAGVIIGAFLACTILFSLLAGIFQGGAH